ncbi:glycosyltransferase [Mycobacterium sp. 1100029.7]|nr:glycosyltransferase [Mycobacterium sp. 1100029.7]
MRFLLASLGSRGDIEPCAAIGRELQRRGHDVTMAVPPNFIGFVESAGLHGVGHGSDQVVHNSNIERKYGTTVNPITEAWEIYSHLTQLWPELATSLASLANGADLLLTDASEQGLAANVAEYYDIPQAALHIFPLGPESTDSQITKEIEAGQRRTLGLPEESGSAPRRALEIQAYDELFFPGLAAEWANQDVRRPFVGGLTLELPAIADEDVSTWIAAGTPPIYFGFGSSVRLPSAAETAAVINAACTRLGERALICTGVSDFTGVPEFDNLKIVNTVNHAAVFPACRAVVHHGGPGTTFAGIRAGVPTLALSVSVDQPLWAQAVNFLEVGVGRPFFEATLDTLIADLRTILTPHCVSRTREVAAQMATPTESAAAAAGLLEEAAERGSVS